MINIRVEHIYKAYSSLEVLKDVSLEVEKGSFVSIMGESGSGKSTLLNVMCANALPDKGKVYIDDVDLTATDAKTLAALRCSKIGIVYQFYNLIPTLSARENILLPIYLRRDKIKPYYKRLDEIAATLKISDCLDKLPDNLSGGQQQRVAIARALAPSPSVLLCDEPTSALDPELSAEVVDVLAQLATEGTTMVMATHDLRLASRIANHVVFLEAGQVVESGSAEAIFNRPEHQRTRRFVTSISAAQSL